MSKTLLNVEYIKDGVCSAEISCADPVEKKRCAAALLSLMDKDDDFADLLIQAASIYLTRRKQFASLNQMAIRSAEIKTKN